MDEIRIVRLRPGDERARFEACGSIHEAEIPDGFLVRLGKRFLRVIYRHLSGSRHAFLFVALRGEMVLGFIAGCENTRELYREFLFRNPFTVGFAMLPLMFSPSMWKRVHETWRYPSRKLKVDLPDCEILNFVGVFFIERGAGVVKTISAKYAHLGSMLQKRALKRPFAELVTIIGS